MNPLLQRRLSLGTLRAFDAVARRLNFRAAAEELHLTQPAVSRQIRTLEDDLGMPLFIRGTRHVELTQAGTALMQVVSPWLETLGLAPVGGGVAMSTAPAPHAAPIRSFALAAQALG